MRWNPAGNMYGHVGIKPYFIPLQGGTADLSRPMTVTYQHNHRKNEDFWVVLS